MKIGLSFINQIRNLVIPSADPMEEQNVSAVERAKQNGGGWVAQQLNEGFAQVAAGYHIEHNDDDTHKVIHASGALYERLRTVALGEWVSVPADPARFTGNGTMTWSVPADFSGGGLFYALIGKTMIVNFNIVGTTVGGVVNTQLKIQVHDTLTPVHVSNAAFWYTDNGTRGVGQCQVGSSVAAKSGTQLVLLTQTFANWTLSAGLTHTQGQMFFEVQ